MKERKKNTTKPQPFLLHTAPRSSPAIPGQTIPTPGEVRAGAQGSKGQGCPPRESCRPEASPGAMRWKSSRHEDGDPPAPRSLSDHLPIGHTRFSREARGSAGPKAAPEHPGPQRSPPLRLPLAWRTRWNPAPATLGSQSRPSSAVSARLKYTWWTIRPKIPGTRFPSLGSEASLSLPGLRSEAPPFPGSDSSGLAWARAGTEVRPPTESSLHRLERFLDWTQRSRPRFLDKA